MTGGPGKSQKECQEDQETLKQLGGISPRFFYLSLVLLACLLALWISLLDQGTSERLALHDAIGFQGPLQTPGRRNALRVFIGAYPGWQGLYNSKGFQGA